MAYDQKGPKRSKKIEKVQENKGMLHFDASLAGRRRLFSALPDMVQRDAKVKDRLRMSSLPVSSCRILNCTKRKAAQRLDGVVMVYSLVSEVFAANSLAPVLQT